MLLLLLLLTLLLLLLLLCHVESGCIKSHHHWHHNWHPHDGTLMTHYKRLLQNHIIHHVTYSTPTTTTATTTNNTTTTTTAAYGITAVTSIAHWSIATLVRNITIICHHSTVLNVRSQTHTVNYSIHRVTASVYSSEHCSCDPKLFSTMVQKWSSSFKIYCMTSPRLISLEFF